MNLSSRTLPHWLPTPSCPSRPGRAFASSGSDEAPASMGGSSSGSRPSRASPEQNLYIRLGRRAAGAHRPGAGRLQPDDSGGRRRRRAGELRQAADGEAEGGGLRGVRSGFKVVAVVECDDSSQATGEKDLEAGIEIVKEAGARTIRWRRRGCRRKKRFGRRSSKGPRSGPEGCPSVPGRCGPVFPTVTFCAPCSIREIVCCFVFSTRASCPRACLRRFARLGYFQRDPHFDVRLSV